MARFLVTAATVLVMALMPGGAARADALAAQTDPAHWQHPVDAPIVDHFRPPSGPYGPGNRGLEYATRAGQAVVAVAAGQVAFAGFVGGDRFVVIAHSPDLRSTYAYLDRIDVSVGDTVIGGQRIAAAAPGFHLTARVRGVYVDPLAYMGISWSVRLVSTGSGPH